MSLGKHTNRLINLLLDWLVDRLIYLLLKRMNNYK